MTFQQPLWLIGALVPILLLLFSARQHSAGDWDKIADLHLLENSAAQMTSRWTFAPAAIATALVALALAGPSFGKRDSPALQNPHGLIITIDVSDSMQATDALPMRLDNARNIAAQLARGNQQSAIVVYAGDAYVLSPFSQDGTATQAALEAVQIGLIPEKGSRPAAALLLADGLFAQSAFTQKTIVMLSDGGGVDDAALAIARRMSGSVTLHSFSIGTEAGAPPRGAQFPLLRAQPERMEALANAGGGKRFETVEALMEQLAERPWLQRIGLTMAQAQTAQIWNVVTWPFLLLALLALMPLFRRGQR